MRIRVYAVIKTKPIRARVRYWHVSSLILHSRMRDAVTRCTFVVKGASFSAYTHTYKLLLKNVFCVIACIFHSCFSLSCMCLLKHSKDWRRREHHWLLIITVISEIIFVCTLHLSLSAPNDKNTWRVKMLFLSIVRLVENLRYYECLYNSRSIIIWCFDEWIYLFLKYDYRWLTCSLDLTHK